MAILYKGEIVSNKTLKNKLKLEAKLDDKENKHLKSLFSKKIWFIGPKNSGFMLYEGKIIEELEKTYKVKVKTRRENNFSIQEIVKNKIYFD